MTRRVHHGDGARAVNPRDDVPKTSWWANYAQPDQRAHFIEAAKTRESERQHLDNIRESRKAAVGIHLWNRGAGTLKPLKGKP